MKFEDIQLLKPAKRPSLAFMRQYVRVIFLEEGKKKTIWAQKLRLHNKDILYRIVAGGEIDKLITIAPENILEEIPAIENAHEDIYWWTVDELRAECERQGLPTEGHKKLLIELLAPGKGINPPYPLRAGQVWDPIRHIWVE